MSSSGRLKMELEQKRQEELRLARVREQCKALAKTCGEELQKPREPLVQQMVGQGQQRLEGELRQVSQRLGQVPDRDLEDLLRVQGELYRMMAGAEAKVRNWNRQKAESQAALSQAAQAVRSRAGTANMGGIEQFAKAQGKVTEAVTRHNAGQYGEAIAACKDVEKLLQQADKAALEEDTRREVVRGLLVTLKNMGFVVEGPQVQADGADAGMVTLVGRLPSGRMARFDVQLDGHLKFDFNGYEGRTCGKQLDEVTRALERQFALKAGPVQVTWKNPDKISKGALDLPSGGRAHGLN
jgi:hypothetical protein